MPYSPILAPVVVLVAWTCIIMLWMYFTRLPAMKKAGISLKGRVGSRGKDLDGVIPDNVQWKSHNYNHLMEQPTVFYAIALSLALMGFGSGLNLWLAWGYVGFRIAHSLVQSTVNIVRYRFLLYAGASLCLIALTLHAVIRLLYDSGVL
jgi:hypothetical protein